MLIVIDMMLLVLSRHLTYFVRSPTVAILGWMLSRPCCNLGTLDYYMYNLLPLVFESINGESDHSFLTVVAAER